VAVKSALARLSKSGKVASLVRRPPTWLIVPPEQEHYGAPPVTWWLDDFLHPAEPGYYVALLSAARHWGSAHYAQQLTHVMVSRQRRPLDIGRQRIVFTHKTAAARTPTVIAHNSVAPYKVSTREATLLDLIRHHKDVGGLEAIVRVAKDFAPALTADGLVEALDAQAKPAAGQRLGFLLGILRPKLAGPVAKWLRGRVTRREALEPTEADEGRSVLYSADWRIEYTERQLELIKELS
jgi:predicted transcriptional regulator of viral defense system